MKPQPFVRWMYWLFDTLFYGQIALYCLFLCFPFAMSAITWWEREITNKGTRIIYDTTALDQQRLPINVSETYDSNGKLLGRTEREGNYLVKTDSTGEVITQLSIDRLNKRLDSSVSTFEKLQLTLPYVALLLLYALSLIWITFLFKKTFGELVRGIYISTSSWLRCQKIGWLLIGSFVLVNGLRTLIHDAAWKLIIANGYAPWGQQPFLWPENWMWLWAGLILLVFAQLFRYGSQLQQEHDLTV